MGPFLSLLFTAFTMFLLSPGVVSPCLNTAEDTEKVPVPNARLQYVKHNIHDTMTIITNLANINMEHT